MLVDFCEAVPVSMRLLDSKSIVDALTILVGGCCLTPGARWATAAAEPESVFGHGMEDGFAELGVALAGEPQAEAETGAGLGV
jgi:hypothetical protein